MEKMMKYPFESSPEELADNLDGFVDAIFENLESEFLVMPRGKGFIDYPTFEAAFQDLRRGTGNFVNVDFETVLPIIERSHLSLIVLRTMLGFTPPEWAYVASRRTGVEVTQAHARTLDRRIRMNPRASLGAIERVQALVKVACEVIVEDLPTVEEGSIHRLDKADTREGLASLRHLNQSGVPYAMLLYERLLGRPFASHRDSVSELIGGGLESAIEDTLSVHGVIYRKMKRVEQIPGFDQAPDFIIPDEFNPKVVIEAKITEDDGTARDKITRVQHLDRISKRGAAEGRRFQVVACIAGRGFGVRREDMKKLLLATDGKVFTLKNLDKLVVCSALSELSVEPGD